MRLRAIAAFAALTIPSVAFAGPPYLTDDPEPTDTGHWEIYAPLLEAAGSAGDYDGAVGAEINYGVAQDVQLTVGLPVAFAHSGGRTRWGTADLEASVKYRFLHDEASLPLSADPRRMPGRGLYLASSSAIPGPGVHGLAGYYAARSALRHEFGVTRMPSLAPERGA